MAETPVATTPATTTAAGGNTGRRIAFARLRDLALIPAVVVIAIVGQLGRPVVLRGDDLINVLHPMSEIALLVLAHAPGPSAKNMDLSLASTGGLAPGVAAW